MVEFLKFGDFPRCPKCGGDPIQNYIYLMWRPEDTYCGCDEEISNAHLEYRCYRCGYIRPMKAKDDIQA
jgi:hypothetical protein